MFFIKKIGVAALLLLLVDAEILASDFKITNVRAVNRLKF
jgi:hypothetical protein